MIVSVTKNSWMVALCSGVLAIAGSVASAESTFSVGSSQLIFFPPQSCWSESSTAPLSASGACGCETGNPNCLQSSGAAGPTLDFSMYARNTQCSCCSHPYSARVRSSFNVTDLTITATGQTGTVTAEFTMDLFSSVAFDVSCSNCEENDWEPAEPGINSFTGTLGVGGTVGMNALVGGWTSRTWSGQLTIGGQYPWIAEIYADLSLGIGRQCQQTLGFADAVALLGPVNADGSIGPVFTFPDCPTCTANAPSIGLVDNYLLPPPGCPGDLDGDGATTVLDFGEFVGNFGRTDLVPGTGGDMDFDGDCDVFDFGMFAGNFGCGS